MRRNRKPRRQPPPEAGPAPSRAPLCTTRRGGLRCLITSSRRASTTDHFVEVLTTSRWGLRIG